MALGRKPKTCSCHDVLIIIQIHILRNKSFGRQSSYTQSLNIVKPLIILQFCGISVALLIMYRVSTFIINLHEL